MRINLSEIIFADGETPDISKVQLLRAGKYKYYDDATLEITADMLRTMKKNFDSRVLKIDCAIDYFHNSWAEAAGWIKEIILDAGDSELWVRVEWTESAKEKILSKEIRYLSADFHTNYRDNETGIEHGATLNGGGLTNRPFVKGMNPILSEISALFDKSPEKIDDIRRILSETAQKGTQQMDFAELKKALVSVQLSDDQKTEVARLVGIEQQAVKLSEEIEALKATQKTKDAEIVKLADENKALKKEQEFAVLLSEGNAVPAQKEAYLSGDMAAFAKLNTTVNLLASGSPAAPKADDADEDAASQIVTLAQEKMKTNAALDIQTAIAQVKLENPKLAEKL